MEIEINPSRTDILIKELTTLWEQSVKASHHFLTEKEIESLRPHVEKGLKEIPILAIATENNVPTGFIGIASEKIEMLFVSPRHIGKGVGRMLAGWAIRNKGTRYIDVNEQNPSAVAIYKHWGFEVYERTETDGQGNHFPILRMKLKSDV